MSNIMSLLPRTAKVPVELEVGYVENLAEDNPTYYDRGGMPKTPDTKMYWQCSFLIQDEHEDYFTQNGFSVKTVSATAKTHAGRKQITLKRNVMSSKGSENGAVVVTNPEGIRVTDFKSIGIGTKGYVTVYQNQNRMDPNSVVNTLIKVELTHIVERGNDVQTLDAPAGMSAPQNTMAPPPSASTETVAKPTAEATNQIPF